MKSEIENRLSKLFALLILSLSLILILFPSPVSAQYFTIKKYHSDIMIHSNSSFVVKETIEVTFERPRHGIYREIPFKYRDEFHKVVLTPQRLFP